MSEDLHDPGAVTEMSDEDCWAQLARNHFGHLAYVAAGEVDIVPLNYVAVYQTLYFRTAEGAKLMGVTLDDSVAFEVDEIGEDWARTVIVHGRARRLSEAEEDAAESLPFHSWLPALDYNVVAIEPREVTGRSFRLVRG